MSTRSSPQLANARRLLALGFSVIPLDHPAETTQADPKRIGKVPALSSWKAFQTARPTDDTLVSWFGNGRPRNLGIVTGAVSDVVVLDCDSAKAVAWADAHLPPTSMMTRTAKGEHRFFRHPGRPIRNKARVRTGDTRIAIDVRADGGYVVAPGSVHATGAVYKAVGSWLPVDTLPVFEPAWVEPEPVKTPMTPARAPRGDSRVVRRARKYLDATPPATEGEGGDEHTFQVCCRLVRGFNLNDEEAFDLLAAWNSRCTPPWGEAELRAKIDGARKYGTELIGGRVDDPRHATPPDRRPPRESAQRRDATGEVTTPPTGPEIDAGNLNLRDVAAQAWSAIVAANDPPTVFRYAGVPAAIDTDESGTPLIRVFSESRMRHCLARKARWYQIRARMKPDGGQEFVPRDALPPIHVVRDLLAEPAPPLPVLTRIVEAPTFLPDGTLVDQSGYHAGLYYAPRDVSVPAIPRHPTTAEIARARDLIVLELFGDFPFVGPCERAHAVALVLSPFVRELIDGPVPLHAIDKPAPGTGATLLVDVALWPALGRPLEILTEARDEDEWRKRLTSVLLAGRSAILIDNVRRRLESAALAGALTATVWQDRLLGRTEIVRMPMRAIWIATGNNLAVSNEVARRTIRIRLDARKDRPWLRTGFRHDDLRAWVRAHRGELVWAALVLTRAWLVAGRPAAGPRLGMFEHWSQTLGGVLHVAGIDGFLGNLSDFYDEADAEGAIWRAFVARWWERYHESEVGVAELWRLLSDAEDPLDLRLGEGSDKSQTTRFGLRLREMRDRQFDGRRIVEAHKRQGARRWRLVAELNGSREPS